jgi:maltoporin
MNTFNLYGIGDIITFGNQLSDKTKLRLVNHTTFDINANWAFHLSLNHERVFLNGTTPTQWTSTGIRPMYRVTPNFHLVTEIGNSFVEDNGTHKLTRVTFAPQLSINESIWGRPVLRAFYTHSFWNKSNQLNIATNAPTYANKTDGGSFGLQMESFF